MARNYNYIDDNGNLVVPINKQDTEFIDGRIVQFNQHSRRIVGKQLDIATSARNANKVKGGLRAPAQPSTPIQAGSTNVGGEGVRGGGNFNVFKRI